MGGAQDAAGARFGALVRERRRTAGLTQRQLAERSGLSLAALRDLEQGRSRRPRPGSLDALTHVLGLDVRQSAALAAARDAGRPASGGAPGGHGSGLWLAVLGPLAAWRDGLSTGLGPPRQAAVAGLLAVQPGELVRRETVIDVLWGQRPPATAAELVQAHVSRLRRVLDPGGRGGLLEQGPAGYRLRAGAGELDAAAFAELARRAGAAAASGDAAGACGLYARALGLWRGEPAADVQVLRGHPAVTGLARRRMEAMLGYADAACRLGWHQRVLPLLEALAREQPLEERVHARLMVALAGAGRQAAAIEAFEALRRRLDEDLGVRPGPELTAAYQRVLRQDIPAPAGGAAAVAGRPDPGCRSGDGARGGQLAAAGYGGVHRQARRTGPDHGRGHPGRRSWRGGGDLRDRRDARRRQDRAGRARRAPAGQPVPGPAAVRQPARPYPRPGPGHRAGGAGRAAGRVRGRCPVLARRPSRAGPRCGGTGWPGRGRCWCWTMPLAAPR